MSQSAAHSITSFGSVGIAIKVRTNKHNHDAVVLGKFNRLRYENKGISHDTYYTSANLLELLINQSCTQTTAFNA